MDTALAVVAMSFDYRKKQVLHSISFSVARGAICGLLGPNASGKTTLLKCINGVLRPREGEVQANGKAIGEPNMMISSKVKNKLSDHGSTSSP